MKFAATIARSLQAGMRAELRAIERAVTSGTRDAGRGLKTDLRRQVASAGLGQRLANSWRDRHYPNENLDAASLVYSKAPEIILANLAPGSTRGSSPFCEGTRQSADASLIRKWRSWSYPPNRSSAGGQNCSGCIALALPISGYEIVEDLFGDMNVRFTA
jgi:hypothetical protein